MNNPNQNKPAVAAPGAADKPQQPTTAQPAKPVDKRPDQGQDHGQKPGQGQAKSNTDRNQTDRAGKSANSDGTTGPKISSPAPAEHKTS